MSDATNGGTAERVERFAHFFKRYMAMAAVVSAALPIPATAFALVPTFEALRKPLSVYTGLFCFLTFAWVFYIRHRLATIMFVHRRAFAIVPLILILATAASIVAYHIGIESRIGQLKLVAENGGTVMTAAKVLADTQIDEVPRGTVLIMLYVGIFMFAEAAFVIMATREYMQDVLGIAEISAIGMVTDDTPSGLTSPSGREHG